MIFVAFVHVDCTVHMRFQPFRVVSQRTAFAQVVVHAVRFDIGFVVNIQSVFVTKLVESAVLRVMAQADGVQIVPFHQFEILAHQFFCHVMSGLRVVFVDIDTFELDRLSVEQQDGVWFAVAGDLVDLFDFDAAETDVLRDHFRHLAIFLDRHQQLVKVRMFRVPCFHIIQCLFERSRCNRVRAYPQLVFCRSSHIAFCI